MYRELTKTWCFSAEDYITFTHELSDEMLQEYESHDPFIHIFIEKLDKLIGNFNHVLVPENYKVCRFYHECTDVHCLGISWSRRRRSIKAIRECHVPVLLQSFGRSTTRQGIPRLCHLFNNYRRLVNKR